MYRGKDSLGNLGRPNVCDSSTAQALYPLAVLFAFGLISTLLMFQANQLTALIQDAAFDGSAPALARFDCISARRWSPA